MSANVWRGLVTDYLRRLLPNGKTLVVVLDGLDEAADWEAGPDLFPLTPPDHVRVDVSARYRAGDTDASDWLRRLGWEHKDLARSIDLSTLTKEGVAQVLVSMGFPLAQLGAKVDIVAELYRLTEGDPLLVRLYMDALWTDKETVGSLKPEDLGKQKPGLTGYFDRWWDEQRKLWGKESPLKEQAVQALLNVLACSLGPLSLEGLLLLTKLSSWDLREALKPLDRFIIGDGKIHGYVFSHPRLSDYFKEKLSLSEQKEWRERFLEWGETTVRALENGTLDPAKAPDYAYIVQYYGPHLEQAHASAEAMMTLVCQGWSKAWEALEGSFAGFLNDVERAWKAAEQENEQAIAKGGIAPRIGDEIRCALVQASINSLASNLPAGLIVQLVKHKKWTFRQGFVYACQIPDMHRRANVLAGLAVAGNMPSELRDQTFLELRKLLQSNDPSYHGHIESQNQVLAALVPHLTGQEREQVLAHALAAAQTIQDTYQQTQALAALVPHLAGQDREMVLTAVLTAVQANQGCPSTEVLAVLMSHLASQERDQVLAHALVAAQAIQDSHQRTQALAALAPHLAGQEREQVLAHTLAAVQAIQDNLNQVDAQLSLVPHLVCCPTNNWIIDCDAGMLGPCHEYCRL